MTLSDSDRLLVNDGSETNTITFAQFKDGTVLNPTDLFLVNDGTKTETISWEKIEEELGPKGEVVTPTVLKPKDGAGSGDERYALTDKITDVEGGGTITCETDLIESVVFNEAGGSLIFDKEDSFTGPESRVYNLAVPPKDRLGCQSGDANGVTEWRASTKPTTMANSGVVRVDFTGQPDSIRTTLHEKLIVSSPTGRDNYQIKVDYEDGTFQDWQTWGAWANGSVTDAFFNLTPNGKKVSYVYHRSTQAVISIYIFAEGNPATGGVVFDGRVEASTTLTFPTSNGFDCFEPGDVVQGVDANQDVIWSQQASSEANLQPNSKAFDGNVDTFNQVAFSDSDSNIVFTLTPVPSGEAVEIKTQQEKVAGTIECNGVSITDDTNTPVITQCGRTTSSTLTIKQNINSGQASQDVSKIFYVKVGDQLLVDQGVAVDNAKITSKDADAVPPTITVDGGEWSDGTSDPGTDQSRIWSNGGSGVFNQPVQPICLTDKRVTAQLLLALMMH